MEKYGLGLALVFTILVLGSCAKTETAVLVLQGNYAYGRGDFQEANVLYLKAGEKGLFPDVLAYNLGNVYHALGESEAAVEQWHKARQDGNTAILPDVLYNEGILLYDLGEYEEAYLLFRRVLELDPLREDARINFEYTIKNINARGSTTRAARPVPDETSETDDLERVLQYVERKEQTLWGTGNIESEYQQDW